MAPGYLPRCSWPCCRLTFAVWLDNAVDENVGGMHSAWLLAAGIWLLAQPWLLGCLAARLVGWQAGWIRLPPGRCRWRLAGDPCPESEHGSMICKIEGKGQGPGDPGGGAKARLAIFAEEFAIPKSSFPKIVSKP